MLLANASYISSDALINELSQSTPCKILIEEANKVIQELGLGALEVRFESTVSGFVAEQSANVIRINPDLSAPKQRDLFVFELTNVIQYKKHLNVWKSAVKGVYKTEEEYTRAMEYIEFCGLQCRNIVSKAANLEKGYLYLENPWEHIPLETMEFDEYYSSYFCSPAQESHKEYYRKVWRSLNADSHEKSSSNYFNNALKIIFFVVGILAYIKWM